MRGLGWTALMMSGFAVALAATACQSESHERSRFVEEHLSIASLDDWTAKRQRGSLVFVGPEAAGLQQHTIAIRVVPRGTEGKDGWVEERTYERVATATKVVLEALPGAEVSPPERLVRGHFDGAVFDVTFSPPGKEGRYQRRHVVQVGQKFVYHLIHTAPEGTIGQTAVSFDTIVASLREEA
jgi:hypothetical protein